MNTFETAVRAPSEYPSGCPQHREESHDDNDNLSRKDAQHVGNPKPQTPSNHRCLPLAFEIVAERIGHLFGGRAAIDCFLSVRSREEKKGEFQDVDVGFRLQIAGLGFSA